MNLESLTTFKVGDTVKIKDDIKEHLNQFEPVYNRYKGRMTEIKRIYNPKVCLLSIDQGQYVWAFRWLLKMNQFDEVLDKELFEI